jgi:putative tryptophan/tyrosine transport system substrate-binding protein
MRRRDFLALVGGTTTWPVAAMAQKSTTPVLGFLHSRGPEDAAYLVAGFRRGLRDAGYIDGQNIRIEYRWANGHYEQLTSLAQELVRVPVSLIIAGGGAPAVMAAQAATPTIPIIFVMSGDAVKLGLAESINRPGKNVTGINNFTTQLDPKRLGILHDLVPAADTIGYLVDGNFPPSVQQAEGIEAPARAMGLRIHVMRASNEQQISAAFEAVDKQHIRALSVASSPYFDTQRMRIVELARQHSVPAIYHFREYATAGGLISYGVDIIDAYRQMAIYTGKILEGAKAGDLPIMQSAKFDLVINLKTAKNLGLTIPSGVLSIADEVIE